MKLNVRCGLASLLFGFFIGRFLREGKVFSVALLFLLSHLMRGDSIVSPSSRLRLGRRSSLCEEKSSADKEKPIGKEGMAELIILDDDDDFQELPTPSKISLTPSKFSLTQEQRTRIAQQKELALSRRMARESMKSQKSSECMASPSQGLSTSYQDTGKAAALGGASIEAPSSASGLKRGKTFSHDQMDELAVQQGWVSVRKRPVPGTSFGQGMSLRGWSPGMGSSLDSDHSSAAEASTENSDKPKVEVEDPKSDWQKPKKKITLSKQQLKVLKAISTGESVFLTGSAGTGKSFVLEFAVRVLKAKYGASAVFVTASTGLAACALGGTTVHAFAGIGLGVGSKESLADKVKSRKDSRIRWQAAKALIVDEISMIDGELFDKLDYIGRIVRNNPRPFGGIQLIVTGDFYQLPPVNPENPQKYFAFEADCWNRCFHLQVELQHVFRQADQDFVGLLNEIRRGGCSPGNEETLRQCSGPVDQSSGIVLTRLYPRKVDVSRENEQNLRALNQPTVMFIAKDEARNDFAKRQLDNVRVEAIVALSVGAQVMLAKNVDPGGGLVNGSRGVVVGFCTPDDPRASEINKTHHSVSPSGVWPLVRFACDNLERLVVPESWTVLDGEVEVAKRTQVPLSLAWALSVHKCQGMTLDRVETDLSRAFDYGMVYVALSRVKSLQGLRLIGFDPSKIRVHPKVAHFYEELDGANASQEEPSFQD